MDKVRCPWCGNEMFYFERKTKGYGVMGYYLCRACEARTPRIDNIRIDAADMKEAALAAAMQRYVEQNRVLKLVEAKAQTDVPIWCEFRNEIAQSAWYVGYDRAILALHLYDYETFTEEAPTPEHSREMAEDNYSKTWRCWLRRPTDEERKAVRWEDD